MHSSSLPFPIPVVAFGPGSQTEEAAAYLPMPQGMETFAAPRLPDDADPAILAATAAWLAAFADLLAATPFAAAGSIRADLLAVDPSVRQVINQVLGFGEVSAFTVAPQVWRVQETAFAGVWRVLELDSDGRIVGDTLQAGAAPAVLGDCMNACGSRELAAPAYPEGVMNAAALVEEIRQQVRNYRAGQAAHVINFTLLPVSEADLDTLYGWLGHREVSILSRGYGNCRITSTRLANVWWVQYFNSMDALILNTLEIVDLPEVALAAAEDYMDSIERLREYLAAMEEA
jgi:hydrogenase-1 operon protein HyaF